MYDLFKITGVLITYGAIISFVSAVLAIPFLAKPNLWLFSIYDIKIVKYVIVVVATLITFMTVTVEI